MISLTKLILNLAHSIHTINLNNAPHTCTALTADTCIGRNPPPFLPVKSFS